MYDIDDFTDDELLEEVLNRQPQLRGLSLSDKMKFEYLLEVWHKYTLVEIEQRLPK